MRTCSFATGPIRNQNQCSVPWTGFKRLPGVPPVLEKTLQLVPCLVRPSTTPHFRRRCSVVLQPRGYLTDVSMRLPISWTNLLTWRKYNSYSKRLARIANTVCSMVIPREIWARGLLWLSALKVGLVSDYHPIPGLYGARRRVTFCWRHPHGSVELAHYLAWTRGTVDSGGLHGDRFAVP